MCVCVRTHTHADAYTCKCAWILKLHLAQGQSKEGTQKHQAHPSIHTSNSQGHLKNDIFIVNNLVIPKYHLIPNLYLND